MDKIRVLFMTHYGELYGANRSMLNLMIDLKNNYNIEPILIAPYKTNELSNILKNYDIKCCFQRFYPWRLDKNSHLKNIIKIFLNKTVIKKKLKRLIKEINPDIIHSNSSVIDLGIIIADELKIPSVWHLREFGEAYNLRYYVNNKEVANTYAKATRLIAISNSICEHYKKVSKNAKIVTIYNGVDSFECKKIKHDGFNFCSIGLLSDLKNQLEVLKATKLLVDDGIENFNVHIVGGGDDKYLQLMNEYIEKNNISKYVFLYGYRKDIGDILKNMDVGISSSRSEAFGRTTVEFMMAGMPVIGTNVGGTKEIIIDNETGYLYESGNEKELYNYMKKYINNSNLIKTQGKKAKERAMKYFDKSINTKKIYEIYKEII